MMITSSPDHGDPRYAVEQGVCQCGCGAKTKLASRNRRDRGWIKGEPLRWVLGHSTRKRHRYIEADTGYATPCWVWRLAKSRSGYGVVWTGTRTARAHRVYYEKQYGSVPAGTELGHRCRVPGCVNPEHLEAVSHAENCRRGRRAKLTHTQVAEIRASRERESVIARKFGISQSQVSRIRRRLCWRID